MGRRKSRRKGKRAHRPTRKERLVSQRRKSAEWAGEFKGKARWYVTHARGRALERYDLVIDDEEYSWLLGHIRRQERDGISLTRNARKMFRMDADHTLWIVWRGDGSGLRAAYHESRQLITTFWPPWQSLEELKALKLKEMGLHVEADLCD